MCRLPQPVPSVPLPCWLPGLGAEGGRRWCWIRRAGPFDAVAQFTRIAAPRQAMSTCSASGPGRRSAEKWGRFHFSTKRCAIHETSSGGTCSGGTNSCTTIIQRRPPAVWSSPEWRKAFPGPRSLSITLLRPRDGKRVLAEKGLMFTEDVDTIDGLPWACDEAPLEQRSTFFPPGCILWRGAASSAA